MYIEVDVQEGPNSSWAVNRMFSALEPPRLVSRVMASDPKGREVMCAVTGWSSGGPVAAKAALVEDSGEGIVMLLFGGDQGIRLKPADDAEGWDLASPRQWGEPCLLLSRDVRME
ncbi:MAG: hypothetical protein FJ320_08770 [SAR202 cluster bacterium]|nr:hypothetical protein [SAR202 cluster bacterium]